MSSHWIQTFTGKKFDLWCPSIHMICVEDIAHHLSLENRFSGATKFPLSVGYHSINMCKVAPNELKLEALFHDGEEVYYKDITSPWKALIKENTNTNLFDGSIYWTRYLIANLFNLDFSTKTYARIKELDLRMAITERNQLCTTPPENWKEEWENKEPFNINILERNWRNVEIEFIDLYNKYKRT